MLIHKNFCDTHKNIFKNEIVNITDKKTKSVCMICIIGIVQQKKNNFLQRTLQLESLTLSYECSLHLMLIIPTLIIGEICENQTHILCMEQP